MSGQESRFYAHFRLGFPLNTKQFQSHAPFSIESLLYTCFPTPSSPRPASIFPSFVICENERSSMSSTQKKGPKTGSVSRDDYVQETEAAKLQVERDQDKVGEGFQPTPTFFSCSVHHPPKCTTNPFSGPSTRVEEGRSGGRTDARISRKTRYQL